ncbi:MAG: hypothetical protein EHM18_03310, partial [Acidobacteria bacterium]
MIPPPHYTGRRSGSRARVFYVAGGEEFDITLLLEQVGISFIAHADWKEDNSDLVELAKLIIWHCTSSHDYTARFGFAMAWDLFDNVEDGWTLPRDRVEQWLAAK